MMTVYFDNAATTPLSEASAAAIKENLGVFGNPSSLHHLGVEADKLLTRSRDKIKKSLGVKNRKDGLVFCAGGSEANNLAIIGTSHSKDHFKGKKIITTAAEHPSAANCLSHLEKEGAKVIRIPCPGGVFDMDAFEKELDDSVYLASVMWVNNETGAIYPMPRIRSLMREKCPDAYLHTDATQAYAKLDVAASHADMITVSGHKIGAPKGIGALYISERMLKERSVSPVILGGGQEGGLRSGTENVLFAAAFAAGAEKATEDIGENVRKYTELYENTVSLLSQSVPEVRINRPSGEFSRHILSLTLPNIKSEVMLHYLSSAGICVSSGSACSSHHPGISPAMLDFGLDARAADCTLRVSFSTDNTVEQTEYFTENLALGVKKLARMSR